ncbi:MAG: copper amine oxidase N-terminal domain-containing protein [Clostridiales bacterium]|nr:copper amine oxidase N-terminal domain-containing protein [Clostridiales bacterium]
MRNNFYRVLLTLATVATLTVSLCFTVSAADDISISIDGRELKTDVPPMIINDRTMVPLRAIGEAFGCRFEWDDGAKLVTIYLPPDNTPLYMEINNPRVRQSSNTQLIALDAPPVIVDGRTLVPLRFIAETIGLEVEWDAGARTVNCYSGRGDAIEPSIKFITQEYKGDNIAEIPYIEYPWERDDEIDAINRSLNQGIQRVYEDFIANSEDPYWMEIKSYPFTSADYLQVVVTSIEYPSYGTDGDLFSINYDKEEGRWLTVDDALKMESITSDALMHNVGRLFKPEAPTQSIGEVKIAGFLLRGAQSGYYVEFLLEITVDNSAAEPWKSYFSYTPQLDKLYRMNSDCLFDPSEPDQMDPPLSYQKNQ